MPNECHVCCTVSSTRVHLSSDFDVPLFDVVIRGLTFLSALYWLRSLGSARSSTIDLYYNVLLAALADFFSLLLLRLIPFADSGTGATVYGILNVVALALQWYIQSVIILFILGSSRALASSRPSEADPLLARRPGAPALSDTARRDPRGAYVVEPTLPSSSRVPPEDIIAAATTWASRRAWGLSAFLAVVAITTLLIDHPHAGTVPSEIALAGSAFALWVSQFATAGSPIARHLPLRAPVYPWLLFLAVSHALFAATYALQSASGGPALEAGYCLNVVSLLFYYLTFAPLLFSVLKRDSAALRDALLLAPAGPPGGGSSLVQAVESGRAPGTPGAASGASQRVARPSRTEALLSLATNLRRIDASQLETAELLGAGQYAEVYRAVWRGVSCAYKRLKATSVMTQEMLVEDLLQEAVLLDQCVHPNVVQLLGLVVTPGALGMVTEFMAGGSLFDRITRMRRDGTAFSEAQVGGILLDVARGMLFLHTSSPPVLHRDLKSQNVLLSSELRAKVADLGASRAKLVTGPMTTVGTPHWMAPEVICGEPYNELADVFSYGVLMWEVTHVDHPYVGESIMAIIAQIVDQDRRPAVEPSVCPGPTARLMQQAWSGAPEARPSFRDIVGQLEQWVDTLS